MLVRLSADADASSPSEFVVWHLLKIAFEFFPVFQETGSHSSSFTLRNTTTTTTTMNFRTTVSVTMKQNIRRDSRSTSKRRKVPGAKRRFCFDITRRCPLMATESDCPNALANEDVILAGENSTRSPDDRQRPLVRPEVVASFLRPFLQLKGHPRTTGSSRSSEQDIVDGRITSPIIMISGRVIRNNVTCPR